MKSNQELERSDLVVDRDIDIDDIDPQGICVYLETWFDVEKKFGVVLGENDTLNLYAIYNPFEDTLAMKYIIRTGNDEYCEFVYNQTDGEAKMIKGMIAEIMMAEYGLTPLSFFEELEKGMGELK